MTAWLAMNEPNPYVKETLDFALLEDFDHLYRYANLLNLDKNIPAHTLVQNYVEITPGRPTIAEHRHPNEAVRFPVCFKSADIQTKLNTLIITSAEQQTMNFYMNIGAAYYNDLGRQLYQEIAMIEEQHVSQYGSLLDPNCTWLENLLLHQYMECYLYYSFYQDEVDPHIKMIWESHLAQEIAHLHRAADLLQQYEGKHWSTVVPGPFPKLLHFHDTRAYVREVMARQTELTADYEYVKPIGDLPDNHGFFWYQNTINHDVDMVPSHVVITQHQSKFRKDYRSEVDVHPVPALRERTIDNTQIGRTKQRVTQYV